MRNLSLKGKSAIITGASRGIGLAIARALQREGAKLALLSRSKPPQSVRGKFIACDLDDLDTIPEAIEAALTHLGRCDFLINNAGMFREKSVSEMTCDEWQEVFRVNVSAPFLICRELVPHMRSNKGGRIVNIGSTASVQGYLNQSAYCASKHALLGFGRALAIETRPHNIHVYTLCPGGVDTDLIKGTYLADRLKGQPMIRPADIAAMALVLLTQPPNIDVPELVVRRYSAK